MDFGFYYFVDRESSRPSEGVTVYRYNRLFAKDDCMQYPVSLYITESAAAFYFIQKCLPVVEIFRIHLSGSDHKWSNEDTVNTIINQTLEVSSKTYRINPTSDNCYHTAYEMWAEKSYEKNEQIVFPIRSIFLDFLFDFNHSSVFKSSSFYYQLYYAFRQDCYLNAIINKANFYFCRKKLNSLSNDKNELVSKFTIDFDRAAVDWVRTIRDRRSDDYANDSKGWLNGSEDELSNVYFCDNFRYPNCAKFNNDDNLHQYQYNSHEEIEQSSKWSLERCYFRGATGLPKLRLRLLFLELCLFFSSILSATLFPECHVLPKISFWIGCLLSLFVVGCCVACLIKHICQKRQLRLFTRFVGVHLLMPRLVAAIVTAWLTIGFNGILFKAFFDYSSSSQWINVFVFSGITYVALYCELERVIPYARVWEKLKRTFVLFLVSFFISVVTGFILLQFTTDRFLHTQIFTKDYMSLTVMNVSDAKEYLKAWYNPITIDYLYENSDSTVLWQELISSLEGGNRISERDMKNALLYPKFPRGNRPYGDSVPILRELPFNITVLWNYLFVFSFFAMFIGVFLQMLSQNKSITSAK